MNGEVMKTLFQTSLKFAAVMLLLIGGAAITAHAQGAKLQMDQLDFLANKASETVDVKLDEHLIGSAAKIFSEKDDADIKEILKGLKGIYVKSFEFEKAGEYSQADVESVMSQLRGGGWSKIVGVKSKTGDNVWSTPSGAKFNDDQYKAFLAGETYVNVHTAAHKGGEIRAQLQP